MFGEAAGRSTSCLVRPQSGRPELFGEAAGRRCRLVGRSREAAKADVAQLAERVLGKDEVTSSILVIGSNVRSGPELRTARQPAARRTDARLEFSNNGYDDVTRGRVKRHG